MNPNMLTLALPLEKGQEFSQRHLVLTHSCFRCVVCGVSLPTVLWVELLGALSGESLGDFP